MIDEIPWMDLSYAYGTAIDVPDQLKSVLDPDPEKRRSTFYSFSCNLFHQGSVYSATVPAIGVLQQMLRYQDVPDKAKILETLLAFAVGFAEDIRSNVKLPDFLALADDDDNKGKHCSQPEGLECYLAVGTGAPLYEALVQDSDPRTAVAAAYILAFFPAHAFASCRTLLDVAQDKNEHEFVRSSALLSCSYLSGGGAQREHFQTLQQIVNGETLSDSEPVPLLAATAAYTLLRERKQTIEPTLKADARRLADHCLEHDVRLPPSDFYSFAEPKDIDDDDFDVRALLMPDPQFPWGSIVSRLQQITGKRSQAIEKQRQKSRRPKNVSTPPHLGSFDVKPDSFDVDNIAAAVRRYHANFVGDHNLVQATKEFAPFQPYALRAWDTILELLDDDAPKTRWAAAAMLEHLEPLDDAKVGQLIGRLHRNNNSRLGAAIGKQKVTAGQCQDLCDRLCRGDFVRDVCSTNRDDYRTLVMSHGTNQQLWMLYQNGEEEEQSVAISVLMHRGEIDESDPRAYQAAAADLLSGHFGRVTTAKFMFAKSEDAQRWFFDNLNDLPKTHRWAVVDAMDGFGADLTPLQGHLFAQIEAEENPVLQSKLIALVSNLTDVDDRLVDRLTSVLTSESTFLQRSTVIRVLGSWLPNSDVREDVISRLLPFLTDDSVRVRQATIEQLAADPSGDFTSSLRQSLNDPDPDIVRRAMWHLSRSEALTEDDLALLLNKEQPDRVSAETLLAMTTNAALRKAIGSAVTPAANGPLTKSLRLWIQSKIA
ncbi:HEAT repeat protein [Stieleria maiorica]|uniref:HEAT repeat protein n=1 Tax=Stieleria maiorica TaxID=2795974 RepID=A0A5B9MLM3_9BACT|nr:HEAT repeat domain-containing protein [Stieleria maiorica]QEG00545.1 HEAT repeat protein [Stieleria maiorica]